MNKEAKRLVDVYRLADLIDADVLDRLDNEAIAVLKGPPDDLPYVFSRLRHSRLPSTDAITRNCITSKPIFSLPPTTHRLKQKFLCTHVQAIQRSKNPDSADNLLKVKVCIYIDALINYFKQVNRVRLNANVHLDSISTVTPKLTDHMTKKFAQPNSSKL